MREFKKEKLNVKVFEDRPQLGTAAADTFTKKVVELLETKEYVNVIFASAPSQNEFLAELNNRDVEWDRINAFHMDEYVGLDKDHPAGFGNFLKDRLFQNVSCREVHYMNGNASDIQQECKRYAGLLTEYPTDIVILGIGENTHLAFNDPHVADFNDPLIVKVVDLDHDCRIQQVNDGCFPSIDQVPTHALTITMPALFKSTFAYAIVPGTFKANAIAHTINSDISELYPSTILRRHDNATLFIDENSASKL
ncbi:glucosamine-6-phosphate deaminase [Daejeonella lutea]|uniref:Glucosamine-6-phosphate deaminase n=1 Tax=Daejeonella lutea TaxID=572036 RepID=A0A1T5AAD1_9SPHI|nr:glucosamine-6-phosphate deaminase [Daejeonella lutea]SKB31962.1 glucosamine-6-phosphate deaminase [Daejeonella lutea]